MALLKSLFKELMTYTEDLRQLIVPDLCPGCMQALRKGEDSICFICMERLPKTGYSNPADNPVVRNFWGVTGVKTGISWLHFQKKGVIQTLMHDLKYRGKKNIGIRLGYLLGQWLVSFPEFCNIEFVVPVPLHPLKEKRRGYNQSALLAQGVAEVLNARLSQGNLIRKKFTATQTKMNVEQRQTNVRDAFHLQNPGAFEGKNILMVDDVVTTGATLINCVQTIEKSAPGAKVSIATLVTG